jgi:hypothetical protein
MAYFYIDSLKRSSNVELTFTLLDFSMTLLDYYSMITLSSCLFDAIREASLYKD